MVHARLLPLAAAAFFLSLGAGAKEAEKSLTVTATAYNSTVAQTDAQPLKGAWGDRLDKVDPGLRPIAVSPDLVHQGLKRGQRVRIHGHDGEFVVLDRTPARWKNRIDVYMGKDIAAARKWGRKRVKLSWTPER